MSIARTMRFAIFGAGGVGGYFGGRLAEAGEEVTLIARGAHLRALRARGLRLESPEGDAVLPAIAATDDPGEVGPVDAVLVTTKAWQLPEAAAAIGPMLGPETIVLGLQNGVEAAGELAAVLGGGRVLGGLVRILSQIAEPGVIRHVGVRPTVVLGELDDSRSQRVRRLEEAFGRARGVAAIVPASIQTEIWRKFMFIAAVSGVGAVARKPVGALRSEPQTREMLRGAMDEAATVARARGIAMPPDAVDQAMAFLDGMPADGTSSMQRDLAQGRRSELEQQNGAVVRLGAEAGVDTPIHRFLYQTLLPLELGARGERDGTDVA